MNRTWSKLGGQLGLLCIAVGIIIIMVGWNSAAGESTAAGQIPYLLSAGALGLALVGLGMALLVVQNARRDRAILEGQLRDVSLSVSRLANAVADVAGAGNGRGAPSTIVVAGSGSYHRPDCRLVQGKDLPHLTTDAAVAEGLEACRICNPVTAAVS